jgi:hypothetical protein
MSVQRQSRRERRRYQSANEWPAWTDDFRYIPTPDDEKAASELQFDGESEDMPDSFYEALADEAAELDRMERGLRHY